MEPAYSYKLPAGTSIFRAMTIAKEGRWYALSLEDAYTYGENITEYKINKDVNLINITSLTFHHDFIDRLSTMFPGKNHIGISEEKLKCLIPLGLIDLDTQKESMTMLSSNLKLNLDRWDMILEFISKLMLNRHRFSTHELDTYMVSILEKIYGSYYDGYISPVGWPTKIHGRFFPRELCMFKRGNVTEIQTYVRPHIGGGQRTMNTKNEIKFDTDHFNKIIDDFIKSSNEFKFEPLWNPHTDYTTDRLSKRNITRKNKK